MPWNRPHRRPLGTLDSDRNSARAAAGGQPIHHMPGWRPGLTISHGARLATRATAEPDWPSWHAASGRSWAAGAGDGGNPVAEGLSRPPAGVEPSRPAGPIRREADEVGADIPQPARGRRVVGELVGRLGCAVREVPAADALDVGR